jgi:uncharacterized membrane protein YdjX (TVP38/TMEM64 family)
VITVTKWLSVAIIVVALMVLARSFFSGPAAAAFQEQIRALGPWGPVGLALAYVAGTVLLVPASPLTLAAGALFGLGVGTLTASLASTTGAALAFLIGRYLARDRVVRMIQGRPRLAALDQAIDEGGWRIVALLRLSPAVPFNLQNYFYGLTSLRFWPYVLTSWLAMMPGTFLYVYLGQVGGAVVSGGRSRSPWEWAVLGVGLLATAALTVYLTRLARNRLARLTPGEATSQANDTTAPEAAGSSPRTALMLLIVALILAGLAMLRSGILPTP